MAFILSEFPALGTLWWIEVFSDIPSDKSEIIKTELVNTISDFESKYSRFKSSSLLSQLNTEKVINDPDSEFVEILTYGQSLYNLTDRKFNILLEEKLTASGYDADYSFSIKSTDEYIPDPTKDLLISDSIITLKKGRVDLGGFGKGYLIDILANKLKQHFNIEEFLINGGGDIYATSENKKPILIHLEHPTKTGTFVGTTTLFNQGFAASTPHKRKWIIKDKTYSHIVNSLDTPLLEATFVKADRASLADAIGTTTLLSSPEEIKTLATKINTPIAYIESEGSELSFTNNFNQ